jgi:hypothetical protein
MKKLFSVGLSMSAVLLVFSSAVFGDVLQMTFEFGAGTANSFSNKRTFAVPCHTGVESVSVTYIRKGDAGAANHVPIVFELRIR